MATSLLCVVVLLAADAGQPEAGGPLLRAKVERRLKLLHALGIGDDPAVTELESLARAVPAGVALARLTYSRAASRWSLELARGSTEDLAAMLVKLSSQGVCKSREVTQSAAGVVSGSCGIEAGVATEWLPAAAAALKAPSEAEQRVLLGNLEAARTRVPDEPRLDELKLQLADAAAHGFAWGVNVDVTGPKPNGAVDVYDVTMTGKASFIGAWATLSQLANLQRVIKIDFADFSAPRIENGAWSVDFTLHADAFRYREGEEGAEQELRVFHRPAGPAPGDGLPPNPFGDDTTVTGGSPQAAKADACRTEGASTPLEGLELDALALVYVKPGRCAMLVDTQGGCHEVRRNTRWGSGKITDVGPRGATLTRYVPLRSGRASPLKVVLAGAPVAKPPAWFCRN
ncbi:MAG: hypothetical protein JNK82_33680 [Myxococcaceae bacterium]|nr:hypothetical protein [Myxococcaceae bacterium]